MKKMLSVIIAVMMLLSCVSPVCAADGYAVDVTVSVEGTGEFEAVNGLTGSVWGQYTSEGLAVEFEAMGAKGLLTVGENGVVLADLTNNAAYGVTMETLMQVAMQVIGSLDLSSLTEAASSIDASGVEAMVEKYVAILAGVVNENNTTQETAEYELPVFGQTINATIITVAPTAEDWASVLNNLVATAAEDEELKAIVKEVLKVVVTMESPEQAAELGDSLDSMMAAAVEQVLAQADEETIAQVAEQLAAVALKVVTDGENIYEVSASIQGQTVGVVAMKAETSVQAAVFMATEDQAIPLVTLDAGMNENGYYAEIAAPMAGAAVTLSLVPTETGAQLVIAAAYADSTLTVTVDMTTNARAIDAYEGEVTEITAEQIMAIVEQIMASAQA